MTIIRDTGYFTRHNGYPYGQVPEAIAHLTGRVHVISAGQVEDPDEHYCGDSDLCDYDEETDEYECGVTDHYFCDPSDQNIADVAYRMASEHRPWSQYTDPGSVLAHIASSLHLPSGLAAADAIMYGYMRYTGWEATEVRAALLAHVIRDWTESASRVPMWLQYAWPDFDEGEPVTWWMQEVHYQPPAPIGRVACCCMSEHCIECFPSGPTENCRCPECAARYQDDLGEPDDWEGLPVMPEAPARRCRFGVEVEFNGPRGRRSNSESLRSTIARSLTAAGVPCLDTGYTHDVVRYWKMTTDASVTGGEIVSPVMSGDETSIDAVREVLRIVKHHGGETARNVGLHVHLDVTTFSAAQLKAAAHNLQALEMFLAAYVPVHRYDGSNGNGATLIRETGWMDIQQWIGQVSPRHRNRTRVNREASAPIGRYHSINFNSLLSYGTIEVRLLGHTLNTAKVRTWIRVLQALMEASRCRRQIDGGADILAWLKRYGLEDEHIARYRSVVEQREMTQHLAARPVAA